MTQRPTRAIHTHTKHAFTLVELSIVLVILGLLVGGVLSGQSLIRAAELRAIVTERDRHLTALNTFRDKYLALPGDMANAYAFWGTACGTNDTTASTGCNGNGNGVIGRLENGENLKLWEHLSRAGLIEGSYDGIGTVTSGSNVDISITNAPASRFPQGTWMLSDSSDAPDNNPVSGLYLVIGTRRDARGFAPDSWLTQIPGIRNSEAWNVDKKTDDGYANTGSTRGDGGMDCIDDGTDAYSIQLLNDPLAQCTLTFVIKQ